MFDRDVRDDHRFGEPTGNLNAEARLADAARPGERDQPVIRQQRDNVLDVGVATNEARVPGRERTG